MEKRPWIVIALAALILLAGAAILYLTRPSMPDQPGPGEKTAEPLEKSQTPANPLDDPRVRHMREAEKIDFGPDTTHEVAIRPEDGKIRVTLSEKFLKEHGGQEFIVKIGQTNSDLSLTPAQYQRFLSRMHENIGKDDDHDHDHDHAHEHGPEPKAGK